MVEYNPMMGTNKVVQYSPTAQRILLVMLIFSIVTVTGVLADTEESLPVVFGCDRDYPPLSFLREAKQSGFDPDLIKKIGTHSSIQPTIIMDAWPSVLEGLRDGSIDVISGVIQTPERQKVFSFTIPYVIDYYTLFVHQSSNIETVDDLAGKRLAILEQDAAIESYVVPYNLNDTIIKTTSFYEAFELVSKGEADYTIAPYSLGKNTIKRLGLKNIEETGRPLMSIEYRYAVQKGNERLLFLLNEAIADLHRSGVINSIREQWRFYNPYIFTSPPLRSPLFITVSILLVVLIASVSLWIITQKNMVHKKTIQLLNEKNQLQRIINALPFQLVWKDKTLTFQGCNKKYLQEIGLSSDTELIGTSGNGFLHSAHQEQALKEEKTVIEAGVTRVSFETVKKTSGEKTPIKTIRIPLFDDRDVFAGVLTCSEDYTEQYRNNEMIKELSEELAEKTQKIHELGAIDPLSGLFNQSSMLHRLSDEIALFDRYGQTFSVIMVELFHLEEINIRYGYTIGDQAIQWIARTLKDTIRNVDIVGRMYGGNFFVILPHTELNDAKKAAAKITAQVRRGYLDETHPAIYVSCGVCVYTGQGSEDLLIDVTESVKHARESKAENTISGT